MNDFLGRSNECIHDVLHEELRNLDGGTRAIRNGIGIQRTVDDGLVHRRTVYDCDLKLERQSYGCIGLGQSRVQGHKVVRVRNLGLFDRIVVVASDRKGHGIHGSRVQRQLLIQRVRLRQASVHPQSHRTRNELRFRFICRTGCPRETCILAQLGFDFCFGLDIQRPDVAKNLGGGRHYVIVLSLPVAWLDCDTRQDRTQALNRRLDRVGLRVNRINFRSL